jgi:RNA polymerase sigma-70 factor, ECF subfamily
MPDGLPNPNAPAIRSSDRTDGSTNMDDQALLSAIQAGSQDAMSAFFDRYSKMVYSVALRVLHDSGEAEDVMQEIFIQVWRNPRAYDAGRGSLGGWLVVVARNRAIDQLRRRRPADPVELFALPSSMNLAQEAERGLLLEKIRKAMDGLPAEQRKAVELAFFEGLSHSEIAEKTGDPLGTVKTRIRLALMAIRKERNWTVE